MKQLAAISLGILLAFSSTLAQAAGTGGGSGGGASGSSGILVWQCVWWHGGKYRLRHGVERQLRQLPSRNRWFGEWHRWQQYAEHRQCAQPRHERKLYGRPEHQFVDKQYRKFDSWIRA